MVGKYPTTLAGDQRRRVVNFRLSLPPLPGQFSIITPKRIRKKITNNTEKSGEKKKPSAIGPSTILSKLYTEGFFSQCRTIKDICAYADTNLARKIKPNEISGKLAHLVRIGDLSREKNSDNQYEYTKP
jgi:hypothetical protein